MNKQLFYWYRYGGNIPRKIKKKQIGIKIRRSVLRKMLSETIIGKPINTMYEIVKFTPHGPFCPKCGDPRFIGSGNKASYPEHWEDFRCIRCRTLVGYVDNSPFIHALECKENNYDPSF